MLKFANSQILLEFTLQMCKLKCANSQMLSVTFSQKFVQQHIQQDFDTTDAVSLHELLHPKKFLKK